MKNSDILETNSVSRSAWSLVTVVSILSLLTTFFLLKEIKTLNKT